MNNIKNSNRIQDQTVFMYNSLCYTLPLIVHNNGNFTHRDWESLCDIVLSSNKKYKNADNLTIITFSSYNEGETLLEKNLKKFGLSFIVARDMNGEWSNTKKIDLLINELVKVNTKYFLALDADDVLLLNDPIYILEEFINGFNCKLLYSGESNSYPFIEDCFEDLYCFDGKFKYLNTGSVIGEVSYAIEFLKYVKNIYDDNYFYSDQYHVRKSIFKYYPDIQIDVNCRLFQTLFNADEFVEIIPESDIMFYHIKEYGKQLKNDRINLNKEITDDKNIFMYWETKGKGFKPEYLDLCYTTVEKWVNESKYDFKIYFLNEENIHHYVPNINNKILKELRPSQKADYFKSRLLYFYGGVWLDCDIILLDVLDHYYEMLENNDFVHIRDTSFCLAKKRSPFVAEWIKRQDDILNNFLMNIEKSNTEYLNIKKANNDKFLSDDIILSIKNNNNFKIIDDKEYGYYISFEEKLKLLDENLECDKKGIVCHLFSKNMYQFSSFRKNDLLHSDYLVSKLFRKSLNINKINKIENKKYKKICFHMSYYNEFDRFLFSVKNIRKYFKDEVIYVYDDHSDEKNYNLLKEYVDLNDNVVLLESYENRNGWGGYYFALNEMMNFKKIFESNNDLDYIFKLDTDSIITSSDYLKMLDDESDLIGSIIHTDAWKELYGIFGSWMIGKKVIQGGGYFIKNNLELLDKMINLYKKLSQISLL